MKLDTTALRYLTNEDWRVLTAVEIGSKNHEVVPTPLIIQLSHLRSGSGVHKSISTLAKANLIARTKNAKYDGYRLTYGGLDYLALHTHLKTSTLYSTGPCIGCGKESDIYACSPPPTATTPHPQQVVLKIHRLGRISFRTIKQNRDYLTARRTSASWMYMSRLSAQKEFAFLAALHASGFPVPRAVAQSRHTVVMEMVGEGVPLRSVRRLGAYGGGDGEKQEEEEREQEEVEEEEEEEDSRDKKSDPAAVGALYATLLSLIVRLATHGLIHGDFNEFNILLSPPGPDDDLEQPKVTLIDFPQTLSTSHPNAAFYFDRDVACVKTFFKRRFGFTSAEPGPFLSDVMAVAMKGDDSGGIMKRLDVEVEASGFSRKMAKELEKYMKEVGVDGDRSRDHAIQDDNSDDGRDDQEEEEESGDGESEDIDSENGRRGDASTMESTEKENPSDSIQSLNILSIQDGP